VTDDLLTRLDAAIGGPDRRTKTGRVRKLTPMKIETQLLVDAKAEIEKLRTLLLRAVEGLEDEGHDLSDPDCGACKLINEIRGVLGNE
jgi:hypothetical protein